MRPIWRSRRLGLLSEAVFWWRWASTRGGRWPQDFQQRLDPKRELIPLVSGYVRNTKADPIRILDVGAGPVTALGYCLEGRRVEITAVDVLATTYDKIWFLRGITPPVRTIYADAERLDEVIEPSSFDFVYSQNSVDHTLHPPVAIAQMIKALKPGGHVLLQHELDEGVNEDYIGLHQWNFSEMNGDFIIWNEIETINMTELLGTKVKVLTQRHEGSITVEILKPHLPCRSEEGQRIWLASQSL